MGKYSYIAKLFAEAGYDVVGYDSYGFGMSIGDRGTIRVMENYYDDGYCFVEKVRDFYLQKLGEMPKIIAFGYSLGARVAVAISNLSRKKAGADFFSAMLLQCPALKTRADLQPVADGVASLVATAPDKFYDMPVKERNEDYSFLWTPYFDPVFYPGPYTVNSLYQLFKECDYLDKEL